jgi:hypothetical protein
MKWFGYFGRDNKFHITETYIEDNLLEAFFISEVEAENKETAEWLCKQILKERWLKIK